MSPVLVGILGIIAFVFLVLLKLPIPFAMILVGFVGCSLLGTTEAALQIVSKEMYYTFSSFSMSVMALFTWMGYLAYHSGLGKRLFSVMDKIVGHLPGGLIMASQAACALFGAISGSGIATTLTIGSVALPEMRRRNYNVALCAAALAAGGLLGGLIPPSVPLLIFSVVTGESVGKLFIAGVLPGILLMLFYMLATRIIIWRNPHFAPPGPRASLKETMVSLVGGTWETLLVFILSIGGLFAGWFTPNEAAAVGAIGVLVISIAHRALDWEKFKKSVADTTRMTAMLMLVIAGAYIFGRFMALSRISSGLGLLVDTLTLPPFAVMIAVFLVYLVLGCFIEGLPLGLLLIPVFLPIVVDKLGYSVAWFGIAQLLGGGAGLITPPVGTNVYVVRTIVPDVPLEKIFSYAWPFLVALIALMALILLYPPIVSFLPQYLTY